MLESAPKPELLRSLGRLVRGLSALFWGLPFSLVVCIQTARTDTLHSLGAFPPLIVTTWLYVGLWQLGAFHPQERVWQWALDRCKFLALINLGLSPFIYWWNQMPDQPFFTTVVTILAFSGLLFLDHLNVVLARLTAMLPDEGLRMETNHFTQLNRYLVLLILLASLLLAVLTRHPAWLPAILDLPFLRAEGSHWLLVFLVLLPLAMTMALIWKIKEMILESVFGGPPNPVHG